MLNASVSSSLARLQNPELLADNKDMTSYNSPAPPLQVPAGQLSPASLQAFPTSPRSPFPRRSKPSTKPPTLFGRLPFGHLHTPSPTAPQSPGLCPRRPATRNLDMDESPARLRRTHLPAHDGELALGAERLRRHPAGSATDLGTPRSPETRGVEAPTMSGRNNARASRAASCEL